MFTLYTSGCRRQGVARRRWCLFGLPRLGAKNFLAILDIFEALRYRRERSKKTITEHDRSVSS
jgi:hypothetical protein